MPRAIIALGGNLGDVPRTFAEAALRLQSYADVADFRLSRGHLTAPVGEQAGGAFHNAAASFTTTLDPLPLLDQLQVRYGEQVAIEYQQRREEGVVIDFIKR